MIVVDASIVVDLIANIGRHSRLRDHLAAERLIAPDLLPVEVASALRGLNIGGKLDDDHLDEAAGLLPRLRIDLHSSLPLIPRVLDLRHNFSAYDASYVALAGATGCPLLTYDVRFATAARRHCVIEVVTP